MQQHEGKLAGSVGRSHLFRYFTVSGGLKCLYYSVYSPCCQSGGKWTKYTDLAFFCSLCRRGSGDSDYFWPRGQMAEAATASEQPLRHGDVHQQAQKSETHSQVLVQLAATSRMSLVQHIWRHAPVKRYELLVVSPQCRLHIHASYSTTMKMNVPMLPLSQPNAVGLILAHGKRWEKKAALKIQCLKFGLIYVFFPR